MGGFLSKIGSAPLLGAPGRIFSRGSEEEQGKATVASSAASSRTGAAPAAPVPQAPVPRPIAEKAPAEVIGDKLRAMLSKHNPSKVGDVPLLLSMNKGGEHALYLRMCQKYG